MDLEAINLLASAIDGGAKQEQERDVVAKVTRIDGDGTAWFHVPGGVDETPARFKTSDVKPGDTVSVRIENGAATITGNVSRPSTDDTKAEQAYTVAGVANKSAEQAAVAASNAITDAAVARKAANSAQADATLAKESASAASVSAANAGRAASIAQAALGAGTIDWHDYTVTVEDGAYVIRDRDGNVVPIESLAMVYQDELGLHLIGGSDGAAEYRNDIDGSGMSVTEIASGKKAMQVGAHGSIFGDESGVHTKLDKNGIANTYQVRNLVPHATFGGPDEWYFSIAKKTSVLVGGVKTFSTDYMELGDDDCISMSCILEAVEGYGTHFPHDVKFITYKHTIWERIKVPMKGGGFSYRDVQILEVTDEDVAIMPVNKAGTYKMSTHISNLYSDTVYGYVDGGVYGYEDEFAKGFEMSQGDMYVKGEIDAGGAVVTKGGAFFESADGTVKPYLLDGSNAGTAMDVVVEQGEVYDASVNNSWFYRKWASGKAEAHIGFNNIYMATYANARRYKYLAFPFAFTDIPRVHVDSGTNRDCTYYGFLPSYPRAITTTQFQAVAEWASTASDMWFSVAVYGYWK